jgi:hypothetical protein
MTIVLKLKSQRKQVTQKNCITEWWCSRCTKCVLYFRRMSLAPSLRAMHNQPAPSNTYGPPADELQVATRLLERAARSVLNGFMQSSLAWSCCRRHPPQQIPHVPAGHCGQSTPRSSTRLTTRLGKVIRHFEAVRLFLIFISNGRGISRSWSV